MTNANPMQTLATMTTEQTLAAVKAALAAAAYIATIRGYRRVSPSRLERLIEAGRPAEVEPETWRALVRAAGVH